MITKELAMTLRVGQELWHVTGKNKDGTPTRARVNGKCQTWKRNPERFRLPMLHGLKDYFYIVDNKDGRLLSEATGTVWCLPERWPIERFWK